MYQNNQSTNQNQSRQWYESVWGLVLISIFLNVVSTAIYDNGKDHLRRLDRLRERKREVNHLEDFHNKTEKEAEEIDDKTE